MIILMGTDAKKDQLDRVLDKLSASGFEVNTTEFNSRTVITASGYSGENNTDLCSRLPGVERVISISTPYKLVSREFSKNNSIIKVKGVCFGSVDIPVIAGPCAIESYEQLHTTAAAVKKSGASILRGGAYKPRTSPYSFQGLGNEGLRMLRAVGNEFEIPVISELTDPRLLDVVLENVDIIQIGTRNMQNYPLLKEVSKIDKPVLLKRGAGSTIEEWLMAAEYIMSGGNDKIILCERGIRTFETFTRNTLDISAVPIVKMLSHLPVIIDPSHGTGTWKLVNPMAKASIAAGADGLIIEVHPCPEEAMCDGPQSLTVINFDQLMTEMSAIARAIGRKLGDNI